MFQTKVIARIKTHKLHSITFFPENRAFYEIMWKNVVEPDTDINVAHALCLLDKEGTGHTLTVYNNYCFYTATLVTRTHLIVTFVRTLPVLFIVNYFFFKLLIRIIFYLLIHKPFVLHIFFYFNNNDNYIEQYGLHILFSLATEGQMTQNIQSVTSKTDMCR